MHDDLDPARGVALGLVLSVLLWAVIGLAAWGLGPEPLAAVVLGLTVTVGAVLLADGWL